VASVAVEVVWSTSGEDYVLSNVGDADPWDPFWLQLTIYPVQFPQVVTARSDVDGVPWSALIASGPVKVGRWGDHGWVRVVSLEVGALAAVSFLPGWRGARSWAVQDELLGHGGPDIGAVIERAAGAARAALRQVEQSRLFALSVRDELPLGLDGLDHDEQVLAAANLFHEHVRITGTEYGHRPAIARALHVSDSTAKRLVREARAEGHIEKGDS
jgi:hypothetical protein